MSYLYSRMAQRPLRTSSLRTIRLSRPAVSSSFSTSYRAELNESDRGHAKGREDVADHYEKHKQDQLKEQKEGKGQWKKELSSNSEQAIKADRGEVEASDDTLAKMQKETAESSEAEKKGS